MEKKRHLTAVYSATHGFFWAACAPIVSFSAVYLQGKGYGTGRIGGLLAAITIASALLQPLLAALVDRARRLSLRSHLCLLAALCLLCTGALLLGFSGSALLTVFFAASLLLHLLEPMLNAVAGHCLKRGWPLDFGIARSIGTLMFGLTSLGLGYAAEYWGPDSLPAAAAVFLFLLLLALTALPAIKPELQSGVPAARPCPLPVFLKKYRRYTLVLIGFFFIAAFHMMTETYLLNMMQQIGGGSGEVGVALLLANIAEFLVIFFYERFRQRLRTAGWLRLSAVFYVVKALLFHLAPSVLLMYAAQLLQAVTFGFYAPSIVHFACEEIEAADTVKGQSVCVAVFTLGGGLGNLLGGQLLEAQSVQAMTLCAFLLACLGAAIVLFVLRKKRSTSRQTV